MFFGIFKEIMLSYEDNKLLVKNVGINNTFILIKARNSNFIYI